MKKRIAFLLAAAFCAGARAENMVPDASCVTTNDIVCGAISGNLFSQEGIEDSIAVPTITIRGKGTRFEITDREQLEIEKGSGRYYSIRLLDGACLWIKDGVSPKCNVLTVGEDYPWRSKDESGEWKKGHAPGVIAFEGAGEIVTGCNKDSGEYPLCYLFLKNGVIKFRQMDPTEGKAGDSLWGYVADRAFFRPSEEHFSCDYNYKPCDEWEMNGYYAWPDSIKYELRRATASDDEWNENNDSWENGWPNQTQFWQLNNIELHCTKWWSRGIGTDGMRLESNNHLPVVRISNNWDVNDAWDEDVAERTAYEWQGTGKYAADNSNWMRDGWTPDYVELTAGKYYLFAENGGEAGSEVSFDKVVDDWGGEMTVGLRDSYEIRGEFHFRKDGPGALQFMGTWLQACNATNTVTLPNGLELVSDMEIYTGRGLTVDGTEWDFDTRTPAKLPEFTNAVTEVCARIKGGAHLPALAKYESGTLRFTGDTKDGLGGDDLWKLRIGEGLVEIGANVTVSCHETVLAPDLKERTDRPTLSLELYFAPGATLETRNVTNDLQWAETASCKATSTNGTLRLTGAGEYALFGEDVADVAENVTLKLGTADAAAPALTLDVVNAEATYIFNPDTRMEGEGTIRKAGPGGVKFGFGTIDMLPRDAAGKPEITFEVSEGFADFGGAVLGESVTGAGEVRNVSIAVVASRAGAIPVCGDGAGISAVRLAEKPSSTDEFIMLGRFTEAKSAMNFWASCTNEALGVICGDGVKIENLDLSVAEEGKIWVVRCTKMPFTDVADTAEIAAELAACADGENLGANITDSEEYAAFRAWADGIDGGQKEVAKSATAWHSYALGQTALLAMPPREVSIEDISMADGESGAGVSIVVAIKDIPIGAGASAANLAKVLGVSGARTPDGAFSEENVSLTDVAMLEGGKAKLTFGPSAENADAKSFFVRATVK